MYLIMLLIYILMTIYIIRLFLLTIWI